MAEALDIHRKQQNNTISSIRQPKYKVFYIYDILKEGIVLNAGKTKKNVNKMSFLDHLEEIQMVIGQMFGRILIGTCRHGGDFIF